MNEFEILRPITNEMIPNIRPIYLISNFGRVYSNYTKDFLTISLDHNGYSVVNLHLNDKKRMCKVHRLVCMAFKPIPNMHNLQVNHINGIKTCNYYWNLEWVTAKENIQHSIDTNLRTTYGEKVHTSVLTNELVIQIASMLEQNIPYIDIINNLGLPNTHDTLRQIQRIRYRETWNSITKDYDFSNYNARENSQIFSTQEIHTICKLFETYGKDISTEFIMEFLRKDFFKSLSYDDKKKYYGAITKIRCKTRFKTICELYNY